MIEISEVMPLYLCNENALCSMTPQCGDECIHTVNETCALHADAVMIYNMFMDTFSCVVDDDGKLLVWEKEKKDGK